MADPLNVLHTIGLDVLYPIVRCEIKLSKSLDISRLERAVLDAGKVIPEIFSAYQLENNTFKDLPKDPKTVIFEQSGQFQEREVRQLDFMTQPQLRIVVTSRRIILYISHILTDGAGTKQFLYLLADCYNQQQAPENLQNHQDIDQIKALIKQTPQRVTESTDHPSENLQLPRLAEQSPTDYEVIHVKLTEEQVKAIHRRTRQLGVTLNDLFMAAFGKTIQQYAGTASIALACPTDMRQFLSPEDHRQLRVQNMTARYNFDVASPVDEPLTATVKKIHGQMAIRKQNKQFLESIRSLVGQVEAGMPIGELQKTVEQNYHVREIAYTNFAIIDQDRLHFADVKVEDCFMTGSFRQLPMYQVAISTFNHATTLAVNMIGSPVERQFGWAVLDHIKLTLLAWAKGDD